MNLKDTDLENKRKQAPQNESKTEPDRFEIALRAVIRRELCYILSKAGEDS